MILLVLYVDFFIFSNAFQIVKNDSKEKNIERIYIFENLDFRWVGTYKIWGKFNNSKNYSQFESFLNI